MVSAELAALGIPPRSLKKKRTREEMTEPVRVTNRKRGEVIALSPANTPAALAEDINSFFKWMTVKHLGQQVQGFGYRITLSIISLKKKTSGILIFK